MLFDALKHHKSAFLGIFDQKDSFGMHPWFIPCLELNKILGHLEHLLESKTDILAIGECGIDRVKVGCASIEIQKEVFKCHLIHANKYNLPIIIHSVKALADILEVLKEVKPINSLMFHAFNGNEHQIKELLKYNSYFSQGSSLFKNNSKINIIPIDKLVLETGDQVDYSLDQIYKQASIDLGISLAELEYKIEQNFLKLYNSNNISTPDFIENLNKRLSLQ